MSDDRETIPVLCKGCEEKFMWEKSEDRITNCERCGRVRVKLRRTDNGIGFAHAIPLED